MKRFAMLGKLLAYAAIAIVATIALLLAWLRWESDGPSGEWIVERHGQIDTATIEESIDRGTSVIDCTSFTTSARIAGSSASGIPALTSSM